MPRNLTTMVPKKLKLRWIQDKKQRQATLRQRRATLLEKAKELSTLCDVAVAVIVYGYGEAVPSTFPSAAGTTKILERYMALPDIKKTNLNIEAFLHQCIAKVTGKLDKLKFGNRNRDIDLVLNEISLGRRHNLDDLTPELAEAVKSSYVARVKLIDRCMKMKFPPSQATAADAAIVSGPQEPLVAHPLDVVPPPLLPMELGGESHHGSFVNVVPTAADVQRVLKEHGLHGMFNPHPQ